MHVQFASLDAVPASSWVVFPVFEGEFGEGDSLPKGLADWNQQSSGWLRQAAAAEQFTGKAEQLLVFNGQGRLSVERLVLVGLGKKAALSAEIWRMALGRAVKAVSKFKLKELTAVLPAHRHLDALVQASAEGVALAQYAFDKWKTGPQAKKSVPLSHLHLVLPKGSSKSAALQKAAELGLRIGQATNFARDLVNEPAEIVTPTELARQAELLAKSHGLDIDVRGQKEIEKLKMGMFLGVARGSVEKPKLIHLSYRPANAAHAKKAPVALVGKAVTFDSGGLSLKPSDSMIDMKTDMAGAAAVLGAMKIIAELKPPFPVHAFMGACENMPAGNAYRLGDVLVSRLGKTVEVTNTDAEGRLILGDVLSYANEFKPSVIIDLATLTGACMVALGNYISGAFTSDDALAKQFLAAAHEAGEEVWRMPLTDLQKDVLKSDIADMKNAGERWGGAINGALFLKEFVGETPWLHLDIAGPSQSPKERGYYGKGATGVGVRTLIQFVRNHS